MGTLVLKKEILDAIKSDGELALKLSKSFDPEISTYTLQDWRRANDQRLTQATALTIISKHLKIKKADLLEIKQDTVAA